MGFKYSITLASFRNIEPIEQTLERLDGQRYDAVEMYGEPESVDMMKLKDTFSTYRIPVCGITGMWGSAAGKEGSNRRLLSEDRSSVKSAELYLKRCIEMCYSLGGKEVNVCLFADDISFYDRTHGTIPERKRNDVIEKAIPMLRRLTQFAEDRGVALLLEPLNRYGTPFCTKSSDAVSIASTINRDGFGILLDTFHMNIEEDSFEAAIKTARDFICHTHFADNNRKMPGSAHIDFEPLVTSLMGIGYNGYISFEPTLGSDYKAATKAGILHIKEIEEKKLSIAAGDKRIRLGNKTSSVS